MDSSQLFGSERIGRVLLKMAPPVMLAQLIQALYNIVDSLFVGRYAETGLTALSIIYPLQLLMIALAVGAGVGLAGCHGGMCDSFRNDTEWQFITGGQWVSHPGGDGIDYTVNIRHGSSPIVEGLEDFPVCSEHYYLHVDPSIEVLATTRFPIVPYYHISNKPVDMPVAWTKFWGNGRVFYNSLGHHDDVFEKSPNAEVLMERGMLWAAQGKEYAVKHGLTTERFENTAKMY